MKTVLQGAIWATFHLSFRPQPPPPPAPAHALVAVSTWIQLQVLGGFANDGAYMILAAVVMHPGIFPRIGLYYFVFFSGTAPRRAYGVVRVQDANTSLVFLHPFSLSLL